MQINARHDLGRLEAELRLYPQELLAAALRAFNRTFTTMRAEGARAMRPEYPGVKAGAIKARMKLQRATRTNPRGFVEFGSGRFSLHEKFGMRAAGRWGVKFRRLPWRLETASGEPVTQEMLERAFRNRGPHGNALVMSRHTKIRTSHEVIVAPGLAAAFRERGIGVDLVKIGHQRFRVVFQQEARYRRLGKRRSSIS